MNEAIYKKIQMHLYNHPIYNWVENDRSDMKVLVIGDTDYASTFVDICLQIGQMIDKSLEIHWCMSSEDGKNDYLNKRPALPEFISVDGGEVPDPYAHLSFHDISAYLDPISDACGYAFTATSDDANNKEIAELLKVSAKGDRLSSYVSDDEILNIFSGEEDEPAFSEDRSPAIIESGEELNRIAFNTHLVWEGEGNTDFEYMRSRFKEPYMHNSSVSFALSIPYKLKSAGIQVDNCYKAADEFAKKIDNYGNTTEGKQALMKVAVLEHRRWLMEKVTQGAQRLVNKNGMPEYASCVSRGSIKKADIEGNLVMHPCITRCTEEAPLSFEDSSFSKEMWDVSGAYDNQLDDLDKASVGLHREMKRYSDRIRANRSELDEYIKTLDLKCAGKGSYVKRNFDRYRFCINNILDRSLPYSVQFETYERMLAKSISDAGGKDSDQINVIINDIRKTLFPVLESNRYRDFKKQNIDLIKQIPFILTNKNNVHICMSLGDLSSTGFSNNAFFRSVASATALNAAEITYLITDDMPINNDVLASKIKAISKYIQIRGMKTVINTVFICNKNSHKEYIKSAIKTLKASADSGIVNRNETVFYYDEYPIDRAIIECITEKNPDYYDGSEALLDSHLSGGKVIGRISEIIPYFEFDSYNKAFKDCTNCKYLLYGNNTKYIQVEDMFALMNTKVNKLNYPDYADDYLDYWEVFTRNAIDAYTLSINAECWNKVCVILQKGGVKCMEIIDEDIGTRNKSRKQIIKEMLHELEKKEIIKQLQIHDDKVSAIVTSEKAKRIFEKGGNLLETYIYFEACKTGWFDDVQTGYEFAWENDSVNNELDCVLTKGYRSILVECKAVKLNVLDDKEAYQRLDSLGNRFGIGNKKVLIWVTDTKTEKEKYKRKVSRGNQLGIVTISGKKDIDNIGKILMKIMEDNWEA